MFPFLRKASLVSDEDPSEAVAPAAGLGAIGRNLSIILSTVDTWDAPGTYLAMQQPPLPSIIPSLNSPLWQSKIVGSELIMKKGRECWFNRKPERDTCEGRQV